MTAENQPGKKPASPPYEVQVKSAAHYLLSRYLSPRRIPLAPRNNNRIRQSNQHYWELETGVTTTQFGNALKASDFELITDFQPAEFPRPPLLRLEED